MVKYMYVRGRNGRPVGVTCYEVVGTILYVGWSLQSKWDPWDRRLGKEIAIGRMRTSKGRKMDPFNPRGHFETFLEELAASSTNGRVARFASQQLQQHRANACDDVPTYLPCMPVVDEQYSEF